MDTSKSEFFHFGILPRVSIHSVKKDQYSCMYKPRELCDCGCSEWLQEGCTMILGKYPNGEEMIKDVHRCRNCNEIRMADHIGKK